jgi:ADP-ribose pyrophosphatase
MKHPTWTRLSKRIVAANPYYNVALDRYVRPDGQVADYQYIDIPGSAMVVPVLPDGRLVLVSQYRYLMGRDSLEFPAGGMPPETSPLQTARRELREETGYEAASWEKIGAFAPYNGVSNEMCHVFVATELSFVATQREVTEEMETVELCVEELEKQVRSGELWDGMTISSFRLFEAHRGQHHGEL